MCQLLPFKLSSLSGCCVGKPTPQFLDVQLEEWASSGPSLRSDLESLISQKPIFYLLLST